jgi:hypothetical protein
MLKSSPHFHPEPIGFTRDKLREELLHFSSQANGDILRRPRLLRMAGLAVIQRSTELR